MRAPTHPRATHNDLKFSKIAVDALPGLRSLWLWGGTILLAMETDLAVGSGPTPVLPTSHKGVMSVSVSACRGAHGTNVPVTPRNSSGRGSRATGMGFSSPEREDAAAGGVLGSAVGVRQQHRRGSRQLQQENPVLCRVYSPLLGLRAI